MSFSVPLTSFFNDVKICVTSYFMYGVSHEGKYCTFNKILVRKAQISSASGLVLPRSSSPENSHLRKNIYSFLNHLFVVFFSFFFCGKASYFLQFVNRYITELTVIKIFVSFILIFSYF
jgi:hypothetical protein